MSEAVTEAMHTPGPWGIEWPDEDEQWSLYHDDREAHDPHAYITGPNSTWSRFASVVVMVHGDRDVEGRANAELIAAAPDLLAAAEKVLADLNARIDQAQFAGAPVPVFAGIADLHVAIAKAKGERAC